ncbi:MAG: TPR repeat protein [Myxococcota bacterium]|jgi:TPR repeat protein
MVPVTIFLMIAGAQAANVPPAPAGSGLMLPAEAACLQSRSPMGLDDPSVAQGLAVVRTALDACLAGADGSIDADVEVACTGRVASVVAYQGGSLAPDAAACVMDTLFYAAFPAHDDADGAYVSVMVKPRATVAAPMRVAAVSGPVAALPMEAAACNEVSVTQACTEGRDRVACGAWAAAMLSPDGGCYEPNKARRTLLLACPDAASPAAGCLMLGQAFEDGVGGDRDRTSAAGYYAWACEGGSAQGCWSRGTLLERGVGVRRNDELALASHSAGCELGDSRSCLRAASILDEGAMVPRDAAVALPLYETACDGGHGEACVGAGKLYEERGDPASARRWYDVGIAANSVDARRLAARLLWNGLGGAADKRRARTLCEQACQAGDAVACRGPQYL